MTCKACGQPFGCNHSDAEVPALNRPKIRPVVSHPSNLPAPPQSSQPGQPAVVPAPRAQRTAANLENDYA